MRYHYTNANRDTRLVNIIRRARPVSPLPNMTVAKLKNLAVKRGIAFKSKIKKANLVNLLKKGAPTNENNVPLAVIQKRLLAKKTVANLKAMATKKGLLVKSKAKKANIINMLTHRVSPSRSGNCIERSKIPLHNYQKRVIEALKTKRGICAVHSVGSGKTLTAVAASQCFLDSNPGSRVYVCTPVSLMGNFKKEMVKYGLNPNDPRYIILSHDTMWRSIKEKKVDPKKFKNDMIIIDEVHNFRTLPLIAIKKGERKIRRAFYMREAVCNFKKVLALTATPIMNSEKDLVNIVSFLTGEKYADRKGDAPTYGTFYDQNSLMPHVLDKGHGLFSFYERPKDDGRFPSYDVKNVHLVMPENYFQQYIEIEQLQMNRNLNFRTDVEAFYTNIRNAVNKIDNTLDSPKVLWTLRKVQDVVSKGGRIIVYSAFLNSGILMIGAHLKSIGVPYNYISGDVPATKRTQIVEDYNSGKVPVLLITRAGGEGLDLKGTTAAIMLEPTWNPSAEAQVFGRAVRSGSHAGMSPSKRKVECYLLFLIKPRPTPGKETKFSKVSADQVIYNFVSKKRTLIRRMIDTLSRTGVERASIDHWSPNRSAVYLSKNYRRIKTPNILK